MKEVETSYKENVAKSYDEKRFGSKAGQMIHAVESQVLFDALEKLKLPKGSLVGEAGCGTGRVLLEVAERGYKMVGIEPSESMMGLAKEAFEKNSKEAEFLAGTLDEIPVEDGKFDFLYSIRVLNQTESPEYALGSLKELLRTVKPGGGILIEFMNYHRRGTETKDVLFGDGQNKRERAVNVRLSPAEVDKTLESHGAEVVWAPGRFFAGMTSYYAVPGFLLGLVKLGDGILSRIFPNLCSRCYVLARKSK